MPSTAELQEQLVVQPLFAQAGDLFLQRLQLLFKLCHAIFRRRLQFLAELGVNAFFSKRDEGRL